MASVAGDGPSTTIAEALRKSELVVLLSGESARVTEETKNESESFIGASDLTECCLIIIMSADKKKKSITHVHSNTELRFTEIEIKKLGLKDGAYTIDVVFDKARKSELDTKVINHLREKHPKVKSSKEKGLGEDGYIRQVSNGNAFVSGDGNLNALRIPRNTLPIGHYDIPNIETISLRSYRNTLVSLDKMAKCKDILPHQVYDDTGFTLRDEHLLLSPELEENFVWLAREKDAIALPDLAKRFGKCDSSIGQEFITQLDFAQRTAQGYFRNKGRYLQSQQRELATHPR